ncbi:MAG: exodeoxyribonuclease III [Acuticoccus sp.]
MKVATYNINNVNRRLDNLLAWLDETAPDVVCLQELKCRDGDVPRAAIEAAGYGAIWHGQPTWNGVAILARGAEPVVTCVGLPGDPDDRQARYVEAAVRGVLIASIYAPNGNPAPGPKLDYKLAFMARLAARAGELLAAGVPVVLAGDYNVVPEPRDIYPTTSYDDNALVHPEARAAYGQLLASGWCDGLRACHRDAAALYTFWDYRRNRFARDAGLRLDHCLLSPPLTPHLRAAGVDRAVRGQPEASDHAPVWVELDGLPG